jgi:hypothetical protein
MSQPYNRDTSATGTPPRTFSLHTPGSNDKGIVELCAIFITIRGQGIAV